MDFHLLIFKKRLATNGQYIRHNKLTANELRPQTNVFFSEIFQRLLIRIHTSSNQYSVC